MTGPNVSAIQCIILYQNETLYQRVDNVGDTIIKDFRSTLDLHFSLLIHITKTLPIVIRGGGANSAPPLMSKVTYTSPEEDTGFSIQRKLVSCFVFILTSRFFLANLKASPMFNLGFSFRLHIVQRKRI